MSTMKALIIAGGRGERMASVMPDTPKSLLPLGPHPLIEHQIILLKRHDITDITILTGYLGDRIRDYLGDGHSLGVSLTYHQESRPLGTAGAIKTLEAELDADFLVFYGDVMVNMHLQSLIAFHRLKRSQCTLVLHPNDHPEDSDLVEIDSGGRITAIHHKPHSTNKYYRNLVNAALYVLSPSVLVHIPPGEAIDFGVDLFPRIVDRVAMYGYVTAEYLKDAGTPRRWREVERDVLDGKPERWNIINQRRAIFMDRDGVINRDVGLLCSTGDFELLPRVSEAVKTINATDFLACIITNQSVIARNRCSLDELRRIHDRMETELGRQGAKLDAIYFCPHHPDGGYPEENPLYKVECTCRKPKTGMIEQAVRELNIRIDGSYMIGDAERDIECGNRAGLTTILVRSGLGGGQSAIGADYCFEDLHEAVTFIVTEPHAWLAAEVEGGIRSHTAGKPFVMAVGGNSQSGKTTLARYLCDRLSRSGRKVMVVSLDDWIVLHEERHPTMTVEQRFRIDTIEAAINELLEGNEVTFNHHCPRTRSRGEGMVHYRLQDHDIVLIDGVVALHSPALRAVTHLSVFCDCDEMTYTRRFFSFYRWKGLSDREIEVLMNERISEEFRTIDRDRIFAGLVVPSGVVSSGAHDRDHNQNSL